MEKGKEYFQEIVLSEREAPQGCGIDSLICLQRQLQVCLLREGPVSYIPAIFLNWGVAFVFLVPTPQFGTFGSIWDLFVCKGHCY